MAKAEIKTTASDASVADFLAGVADPRRREETLSRHFVLRVSGEGRQ